jgi:Copper acquisition factor BIM1-like
MRVVFSVLVLALLGGSRPTLGHVRIDFPTPRSSATGLKLPAPCGGVAQSSYRSLAVEGAPLSIVFTETVHHPGYFNLSWAANSGPTEASFETKDYCWLDEGHSNNVQTQKISVTPLASQCAPGGFCTVRIIQFMSDSSSTYFSCSDIQLVNSTVYAAMMGTCSSPCVNPDFDRTTDACTCNRYSAATPPLADGNGSYSAPSNTRACGSSTTGIFTNTTATTSATSKKANVGSSVLPHVSVLLACAMTVRALAA